VCVRGRPFFGLALPRLTRLALWREVVTARVGAAVGT
jgi:hypothetical protein